LALSFIDDGWPFEPFHSPLGRRLRLTAGRLYVTIVNVVDFLSLNSRDKRGRLSQKDAPVLQPLSAGCEVFRLEPP